MSDIKFIDGLIVKEPHERAPDFVKAKLSIKRAELIAGVGSGTWRWTNGSRSGRRKKSRQPQPHLLPTSMMTSRSDEQIRKENQGGSTEDHCG